MFTQIEVRGPDADTFLQAQLTQDLRRVTAEYSPLAAWCNPQGRVLVVLRLLRLDDGVGLILPSAMATDTLGQLHRYRLRANIEFAAGPAATWRAMAISSAADRSRLLARALLPVRESNTACQADGIYTVQLSTAADCVEIYGKAAAFDAAALGLAEPLAEQAWHAARIAAGIADIGPATSAQYTPHMLNLDRLGAVHFSKGCYTGQEIIARTQHRGNAKRRLQRFFANRTIAVGDKLLRDDQEFGEVVATAGCEFLAMLPVAFNGELTTAGGARAEPAENAD